MGRLLPASSSPGSWPWPWLCSLPCRIEARRNQRPPAWAGSSNPGHPARPRNSRWWRRRTFFLSPAHWFGLDSSPFLKCLSDVRFLLEACHYRPSPPVSPWHGLSLGPSRWEGLVWCRNAAEAPLHPGSERSRSHSGSSGLASQVGGPRLTVVTW